MANYQDKFLKRGKMADVRIEEQRGEIAQLWPRQGEWTEEDYFALPDTNRFIELSEGKIIIPPHPTRSHQSALKELFVLMRTFIHDQNLGEIQIAPLPVLLWPGKIREPDILFVAKGHEERIGEQFYGPPDLVVEITSAGTRKVDREEKFVEYARAGIAEYWLVDPEAKIIEVFVLRGEAYDHLGKWGPGETAYSQLLTGFKVSVDTVCKTDI
jgi:Uma2 family endonuclease